MSSKHWGSSRLCARALAIALSVVPSLAFAQVVRDGTIGPDASVQPTGPDFSVLETHGDLRGTNLFHSFREFSIRNGQSATFTGRDTIENVISRVTGGNPSAIDGLLRSTINDANFYLLNPAGVLFGPNATIDIDGALKVGTAETLEFSSGETFDAGAGVAPILSVAEPTRFGFLGAGAGEIVLEGSQLVNAGDIVFDAGTVTLRNGAKLATEAHEREGGDITITAANDVGLSGLSALSSSALIRTTGEAGSANGGSINVSAANVSLEDGALLAASDGGDLSIEARERVVLSGSAADGTASTLTTIGFSGAGSVAVEAPVVHLGDGAKVFTASTGPSAAGDIRLSATESVTLSGRDGSSDDSRVSSAGLISFSDSVDSPNSGAIRIDAPIVRLEDGANIATASNGAGVGGDIAIVANNSVELSGISPALSGTTLFSNSTDGPAGRIRIETRALRMDDGASVGSATFGLGSGGNIDILATGAVALSGANGRGEPSELVASSEGSGAAGSVRVAAATLTLIDGANIKSDTSGAGPGGDIDIVASDSLLIAGTDASGEPSQLSAATQGEADAGSISLRAPNVDLDSGGKISTDTFDGGAGGNIFIEADMLSLKGVEGNATRTAALVAQAGADGDAGRIEVQAREVRVSTGAILSTFTQGAGAGGDISIDASERIVLSGGGLGAITSGEGPSGSIELFAPLVAVEKGALVTTNTLGAAPGGKINVGASELVEISGGSDTNPSGLTALASSEGPAGSIDVRAPNVRLDDGGAILTATAGTGAGGKISVTATDTIGLSGTGALARTLFSAETFGDGPAGAIELRTANLTLDSGAGVFTSTSGIGRGGKITVAATETMSVSGAGGFGPTGLSAETSHSADAGSIELRAPVLTLDGGAISTGSTGTGNAGRIIVDARDSIELVNGSSIGTFATDASGGEITLNAARMLSLTDSDISTNVTRGSGSGGNITIDPEFVVLNRSAITAQADAGQGGNISIEAGTFLASTDSVIDASAKTGINGRVQIDAPEVNADEGLAGLATEFLNVSALIKPGCAAPVPEGSLTVANAREGLPTSPDGLLPAFELSDDVLQLAALDEGSDEPNAQALMAFRGGDFETAHRQLTRAADAGRGPVSPTRALRRAAESEQALGNYDASIERLRGALRAAVEENNEAELASILGSLGNAMVAAGTPQAAAKSLTRALELARESGDVKLETRTLNNLGNHYAARGQLAPALDAYQSSARLARESGLANQGAKALANAARAALEGGKRRHGLSLLAQVTVLAPTLEPSHDKAIVLAHIARSHEQVAETPGDRRTHLPLAYQALYRAVAVSVDLSDERALSHTLGGLGALYRKEARFKEALYLTRRALQSAEKAHAPELVYRWHWQEGNLLWAQARTGEALDAYRRAIAGLEALRPGARAQYGAADGFFRRLVAPVYLDFADALLQSAAEQGPRADSQRLLSEARDTVEQLKTAQLRNYFHSDCIADLEARSRDLDTLSPSAAVVYPIVLPDRMELLVSSALGLERYRVPVGAPALNGAVRELRAMLEARASQTAIRRLAQRLYGWLVSPYADRLQRSDIDTLVFVPDGALRTIPLAALHDGRRFLIERYAVAVTPGLSLTDPKPLDRDHGKLLLAGVSESVRGFPALEHVPDELDAIQRIFGGDLLLDGDFTAKQFEQTLRDTSHGIVHIASHAKFTGDAETSFLLAHDGPLSLGRLNDAVGLAKFRDQPLELLVLSACETAAGSEGAALGLSGVSIEAGARSALGSLWSVSDKGAFELMVEFYRQLQTRTVSKAEALRRAQRKLLADESFAHPFYWSSFMLINNWL